MSHEDNARIWFGVARRNRAQAADPTLSPAERREAARHAREAERMGRKDMRDAHKGRR